MNKNSLTYNLIRSNRKTLGLTIERDGEITLRAPNDCPQDMIDDFFQQKQFWIHKKLAEKELLEEEPIPKRYVNGEGFLYLGKSYRLQIVDDGPPLKLSYGYFMLNRDYLEKGKETFIQWYREHAVPIIKKRIAYYKKMLDVDPEDVRVFDLKYRWGSCSAQGNLNFHWKTILAPISIVDYVVVHEMVHLKEKNHTDEFWSLLASILPDYDKRKEWLRVNGTLLEI